MNLFIVKNSQYQQISEPMSYESAYNYALLLGNGSFVDNYY